MLADAPLPHGSGANLAVVGTLSEGFGRIVASPPYLVGYVRWDARSDRFTSLCQTIFFNSFTGRTLAMSLTTPFSVQKLQTALHAKAKESPNFRFHALYDKVYRKDVLAYAYERCKANGGAAGVDNQTFENIEAYGKKRWLDELAQELKSRTYQPLPVRRVYIPKPDGKQRPLGIPTIRDRVVQTSAMLVLEPIFEADLHSRSNMPIGRTAARWTQYSGSTS
jgi:hypothetical protein